MYNQYPQQPILARLYDLKPLFSDHEEVLLEEPTRIFIPSLSGTSAPLRSNPALTDTLRNFPYLSSQAGDARQPEPVIEGGPSERIKQEF